MRIIRAEVSNYRNIDGITVELNPSCNYIIGENNIGKSNFLDMLNTVCNGKPFSDDDFSNQELPIEVNLSLALTEKEWGFFGDNFSSDNPSVINISYRQKYEETYPMALCVDTGDNIPIKYIRRINYYKYESTATPGKELKLDGKKGMGTVMTGLVDSYVSRAGVSSFVNNSNMTELTEFINKSLYRIKGFRDYKIRAAISSDTSDFVTSLLYLSDGNRKLDTTGSGVQYIAMASIGILCYIMDLFKTKGIHFEERLYTDDNGKTLLPMILSIDEPEVHLHPYLQRSLIGYYKRILNNEDEDFQALLKECFNIDGIIGQIIIVTHSTDALIGDYRNLIRFYKEADSVKVISGATPDLRLTDAKEKHLIMHFPEIKEAFYAHCAILIEGETEFGCIQGFARTLGISLDDLGICVINAQGEQSIKPLRELLRAFKIPSIAIYDGDVKNGKKKTGFEFFTDEVCFEAEIVKKLFDTNQQALLISIVTDLADTALDEILDKDFVRKYFGKIGISLDDYEPKSLSCVDIENEVEFCSLFSAWLYVKKGTILGRLVGESLTRDLIPECYSNAILKAQEVALNG